MSSAIGEDTKRTVARGRATVGSMLSSAQDDLRKAFLVFVAGFLGTFYALRMFIWDQLRTDLHRNHEDLIEIIAVTPFDVILLQAKIGIIVGIIVTIPVLIYFGRDGLRERGLWPADRVPRWKLAVVGLLATGLFVGGILYAYNLFFPLMLGFLATNAANAGFQPSWSIVKWTQFIAFLSLSFGLAAQLPLMMSLLSYLRIVPYRTFRDKWRYAVVGIFGFGAVFSPPDPITQIMWALPLIGLYGFSLVLARFAEVLRRSSDELAFRTVARDHWNQVAGVAVIAFGAVYLFFTSGGIDALNSGLGSLPAAVRPGPLPDVGTATGLDPQIAAAIAGALVAAVAVGGAVLFFAIRDFDTSPDPADPTVDPAEIDLADLDADGVEVAPPEVFEEMDEEEALQQASSAMEADDPDKAQAILDRYDEVQERLEAEEAAEEAADGTEAAATDDAAEGASGDDDAGAFTSTTTGVVDAFTEEETTEDDIGGYYRDIAFILESLTSRAFRIAGVFLTVMTVTFVYLYRGGIGDIKNTFLARMPQENVGQVDIVTLHPVEALIFEIKFATLLGLVATLPVVLYYMWPALKDRGLVGGDRRMLLVWGLSLFAGVIGGSIVGFLYVAPAIISWLANDAIRANMVIFYRINNFGWLVVFTTVGIGLLVEIPVTMLLFHKGRLVPFATMLERWRGIVLGIFVVAAFLTPSSLLTMLVFSIPVALAYLAGLGILWAYTLGGRRVPETEGEAEPEEGEAAD